MLARFRRVALPAALSLSLVACSTADGQLSRPGSRSFAPPTASTSAEPKSQVNVLPGMPAVLDTRNVYAAAGPNMLADQVKRDRPLVYVPHAKSGDVWIIDPATYEVVARHHAGIEVQHVVPSHDLRTLYATDDLGDQMLPFDAATGTQGAPFPVIDPYNLYFTPDGKSAISVAERLRKLVWYDPRTWTVQHETLTPACAGIDHGAFTLDGRIGLFSCEFAGRVAVIDVASRQLLRVIDMPERNTHMGPQDVALAPDGSVFFVADCDADGLWVIDGAATTVLRFVPTGDGAHGLYFDRQAKRLFVTNRNEGSVSVLDAYTAEPITKWKIPGGGSPDMGNLTADGTQLWLSGRYHGVVYVLSTVDGSLLRKIRVGSGPHGLTVWPQPGRYSLGHTGITR